jgi:hypothetical protein
MDGAAKNPDYQKAAFALWQLITGDMDKEIAAIRKRAANDLKKGLRTLSEKYPSPG